MVTVFSFDHMTGENLTCTRSGVPPRKKIGTPDRRLVKTENRKYGMIKALYIVLLDTIFLKRLITSGGLLTRLQMSETYLLNFNSLSRLSPNKLI